MTKKNIKAFFRYAFSVGIQGAIIVAIISYTIYETKGFKIPILELLICMLSFSIGAKDEGPDFPRY